MLLKIQCLLKPVAIQGNIKDTSDLYLHCKFNISKVLEKMPTQCNQVARREDHPTACNIGAASPQVPCAVLHSTVQEGCGGP